GGRGCAAGTCTRARAWRRRSTGPVRWPRWGRRGSTPAWSAPRWVRRSSTRRIWNACATRCLLWSRRINVLEQRPDLLTRLGAFARMLHAAGLEAGQCRPNVATRTLGVLTVMLRDNVAREPRYFVL